MIVVDASVVANALADDDEDGDRARARLTRAASLHAPHFIDLEILSVLRRARADKRLDDRRAQLAVNDLRDLALIRYAHEPFAQDVWDLRHNLTPYDAVYVALAHELDCPLVTGDERLARAPGLPCPVEGLS